MKKADHKSYKYYRITIACNCRKKQILSVTKELNQQFIWDMINGSEKAKRNYKWP